MNVKTIKRWKDHSTGLYHDPGDVVTVSEQMARELLAIGWVKIEAEKPKRKRGRPPTDKAAIPSEDK